MKYFKSKENQGKINAAINILVKIHNQMKKNKQKDRLGWIWD